MLWGSQYKLGQVYVPEEMFRRVVAALADLLEQGEAHLAIDPPVGRVYVVPFVEARTSEHVQAVLAEHGTSIDERDEALLDLAEALTAVAEDAGADEFAEARATAPLEGEAEARELATLKYQLVEEVFPVDRLRRRLWIKRTSKVDVLDTLEWEIAAKIVDDDYVRPGLGYPLFATLMLRTAPPQDVGEARARTTTVFTVDSTDVAFLMRVLRRLERSFEELEEAEQNVIERLRADDE